MDVIYIDFVKAFDSICHRKLVTKIQSFGINHELLKWISAFTLDRRQRVKIENCFSSDILVTSGVPQGSVIGPYLFLMYINDIASSVNANCKICLFADDLKIFQTSYIGNFNDLSNSLSQICNWSEQWQMCISQNKTTSISFGSKLCDQKYHLNDIEIDRVMEVCDIGITFSSDMKFSCHCNKIASKAMSRAYLILRCFTSNNPFVLMKAFSVYVRPIVEYCTQVWSPYLVKDIVIVEKVQKYFTRHVCRRGGIIYTDYQSRLSYFRIHSLEKRRIFFDLVLVYKMLHGMVDLPFCKFFHIVQTNVATRKSHDIVLQPNGRSHINCRRHFFSVRAAGFWNCPNL